MVDSSGLEFTLTPELRKYDAAIMSIGHHVSPVQVVPPGEPALTVAGHCSYECLNQVR